MSKITDKAKKEKYFVFSVPTAYIYEIQAETEKKLEKYWWSMGALRYMVINAR